VPDWGWQKIHLAIQAEEAQLGRLTEDEILAMARKEAGLLGDYSEIEKSALEISNRLGMLQPRAGMAPPFRDDDGFLNLERLDHWAEVADEIQGMFFGRDARHRLPKELSQTVITAQMEMVLFYGRRGISVQIIPRDTGSALLYHAAQMITHGTKLMNCDYCGKPFFSGGEGRGGGKRRRDARFCSSEHRWQYHNEVRAARKRKL
jgi:hypothetical protein